ncbi:MAG: hypothetical protein HQL82_09615 [Magnetococcales bacterium]|nr:hypothetical protein [Magnetococcales bacterium]
MPPPLDCLYCGDRVRPGLLEYLIPSPFGGRAGVEQLLCGDCHRAFREDAGDRVEADFGEQFRLLRTLFSLPDHATGGLPPLLEDAKPARFGRGIHLGPGGVPLTAKGLGPLTRADNGDLLLEVVGPDWKKCLPLLGEGAVDQEPEARRQALERRRALLDKELNLRVTIGGDTAARAVLKSLFGLLFHLQRSGELVLDPPLAARDFIDLREFVRYGSPSRLVYAGLDFVNPIPFTPPPDDLSHYLFIHGSAEQRLVFGRMVLFGSVVFSGVLRQGHAGPDFARGWRQEVGGERTEILRDLDLPRFDKTFHRKYYGDYDTNLGHLGRALDRVVGLLLRRITAGQGGGAVLVGIEDDQGRPILPQQPPPHQPPHQPPRAAPGAVFRFRFRVR